MRRSRIYSVALVTFLTCLCAVIAQGPLAPTGAPAPTMKTLVQIEPRTPIDVLPSDITEPGAYYVISNLTGQAGNNGITIMTDDVTLDLNGFALNGVPASIDGIRISGNLIIRNSGSGNTVDYDIAADNKVGLIVSAPNSLATSGSTSGAGVGTTDPWANFTF